MAARNIASFAECELNLMLMTYLLTGTLSWILQMSVKCQSSVSRVPDFDPTATPGPSPERAIYGYRA